jgi:hypothetical protein
MDVRFDVVDQIGPTFDSVYYDNPCTAKLAPGVTLTRDAGSGTIQPGDTLTAGAWLVNEDNTDVRATWVRQVWYDADGEGNYSAGDSYLP